MFFSCAREELSDTPVIDLGEGGVITSYSTPSEESMETDSFPFPVTHTGCSCFMRIESVDGLDNNTPGEWALIDATPPNAGDFEINGQGNNAWRLLLTDPWHPLPSDYFELNQPSTGTHMFYLTFGTNNLENVPANFAIHTRTTCISVDNKGRRSLGSTYLYTFIWKDGGPPFVAGIAFVPFWKSFYCKTTSID